MGLSALNASLAVEKDILEQRLILSFTQFITAPLVKNQAVTKTWKAFIPAVRRTKRGPGLGPR